MKRASFVVVLTLILNVFKWIFLVLNNAKMIFGTSKGDGFSKAESTIIPTLNMMLLLKSFYPFIILTQ